MPSPLIPPPITLSSTNLSGRIIGLPLLTSWSPTRTELFALGTNLCLYHKWRNGTSYTPFKPSTTSYEKLGEKPQLSLAGVCWGENRVDLFGVGADGNTVDHKWYDGDWHDWETLHPLTIGGNEVTQPRALGEVAALTLKQKGLVMVIWRGTDSGLWFMHWREDKKKWMQIKLTKEGVVFVGSPRVVAWTEKVEAPGKPEGRQRWRVDVFARAVNGRLLHTHWNEDELGPIGAGLGTWLTWKEVGLTPIVDDPELVQWRTHTADGKPVYHMNLFSRDPMSNVVRTRWSSEDEEDKWTPEADWEFTGLQALTPPGAVAWMTDKIGNVTVAVLDTANQLRVAKQDGSEWWHGKESWKTFKVEGGTPCTHRPLIHPNGGPLNEQNPLEVVLRAEDASLKQVMVKWEDMQ